MTDPYYSPGDRRWAIEQDKLESEQREEEWDEDYFDTAVRITREHARRVADDRQAGKV